MTSNLDKIKGQLEYAKELLKSGEDCVYKDEEKHKAQPLPAKCKSCGAKGLKLKGVNEMGTWHDCPSCGTTGLVPNPDFMRKADDDIDAKTRAKIKDAMDQRNFTEADAARHVIDRDRGESAPPKPKKPLLQSEHTAKEEEDFSVDRPPVHDGGKSIYVSKNGQWKI